MNYAIPTKDVQLNLTASVLQQGAGILNVYNSLSSLSVMASLVKINLNDTINGDFGWRTLWIKNDGNFTRNFTLKHYPVISVDGYINGTNFGASFFQLSYSKEAIANVEFNSTWIEVGPNKNKSVSVKISPPQNLSKEERWFYSGYIQFVPTDKSSSVISIPYGKHFRLLLITLSLLRYYF